MWFKVDDNLAFHSKVMIAGNAALGLWVRAGSWSMQMLTDGYIPSAIVRQLGTESQARKLVEARLWETAPEGWRFHGWDERQPSRVSVEAEREKSRARQARAREAAAIARKGK